MNLQPFLETDLILLRPLRKSDFDLLYEVAKDPMIWEQHQCSDRYKRDVYSKLFKESLESKGALIVIDKSNDQVIGSIRYKMLEGTKNAIEIGWSFLSRDYWGGTYNKTMKKLMLDHAFKSVDDVVFYIDKENIRSQKAVEKIGGQKIALPQYRQLMKNIESDLTYWINKRDWIK